MKKFLKSVIAIASAFVMVTVSGCGNTQTVNPNTEILQATANVKNYKGTTDINFDAVSVNRPLSMGTSGNIELNVFPFVAKIDFTTSAEGEGVEPQYTSSELILQAKDGVNNVYLNSNDEWTKNTVESNRFRTAASQYDVMEVGRILVENSPNIIKIISEDFNGKPADKYQGTIPVEQLSDVMKQTGTLSLIGKNIGKKFFKKADDPIVTVWVDENNVIVGYEMELTDLVQEMFKALYKENNIKTDEGSIHFNSYLAKGVVTEYDTGVDTEIPQEALDAKDITQNNSDNN